jgi:hypothetical protein
MVDARSNMSHTAATGTSLPSVYPPGSNTETLLLKRIFEHLESKKQIRSGTEQTEAQLAVKSVTSYAFWAQV